MAYQSSGFFGCTVLTSILKSPILFDCIYHTLQTQWWTSVGHVINEEYSGYIPRWKSTEKNCDKSDQWYHHGFCILIIPISRSCLYMWDDFSFGSCFGTIYICWCLEYLHIDTYFFLNFLFISNNLLDSFKNSSLFDTIHSFTLLKILFLYFVRLNGYGSSWLYSTPMVTLWWIY